MEISVPGQSMSVHISVCCMRLRSSVFGEVQKIILWARNKKNINIVYKLCVFKYWTTEKVQNLNDSTFVIILMYSEMYQILNLVQRPTIIINIFLFLDYLLENSGEIYYDVVITAISFILH